MSKELFMKLAKVEKLAAKEDLSPFYNSVLTGGGIGAGLGGLLGYLRGKPTQSILGHALLGGGLGALGGAAYSDVSSAAEAGEHFDKTMNELKKLSPGLASKLKIKAQEAMHNAYEKAKGQDPAITAILLGSLLGGTGGYLLNNNPYAAAAGALAGAGGGLLYRNTRAGYRVNRLGVPFLQHEVERLKRLQADPIVGGLLSTFGGATFSK